MKEIIEKLILLPFPLKPEDHANIYEFFSMLARSTIKNDCELDEELYLNYAGKLRQIFAYMERLKRTSGGLRLYTQAENKAFECARIYFQQSQAATTLKNCLLKDWHPPSPSCHP